MLRRGLLWTSCLILAASPASAGLYDNIYYGLGILATPSGSPLQTLSDGTRVNGARSGRVRILPNDPGNGYQIEFDRTFGVDSKGRPEVLDLGAVELQLQGTTSATLGYTSKGFLIGNADISASNLQYSLRGKTGLEDAELRGVFDLVSQVELNQFGFYTVRLDAKNANSEFIVDGVVDDTIDTNFDIGPISLEGNIFVDAVIALLDGLGVDTSGLEALTPKSPVDSITDQISTAIQKQATALGIQFDQDGAANLAHGDLPAATTIAQSTAERAPGADTTAPQAVPEPGTLMLMALGLGVWGIRRRG